jgi:hypothetical protein
LAELDALAQSTLLDKRSAFSDARIEIRLARSGASFVALSATLRAPTWQVELAARAPEGASSEQSAEALWIPIRDAICQRHWLGQEEPLTPEQLASGDFEVEGDGARSFCKALETQEPWGPDLLSAFADHRAGSARIFSLTEQFRRDIAAAGQAGLVPRLGSPLSELSPKLHVASRPDGSARLFLREVLIRGPMGSQCLIPLAKSASEIAERELGAVDAPAEDLWRRFAALFVAHCREFWNDKDAAPAAAASERLLLAEQAPEPARATGQRTPRI